MKKFIHYFRCFVRSNALLIALSVAWCAGCMLGCYFAHLLPDESLLAVRSSILNSVGIGDALITTLLPFALYVVLLHLYPPVVIPITLTKATLFAFSFFSLHLAFGSAGWLVRSLLLFSDVCLIAPLLWCSCKRFSGDDILSTKIFTFFAVFVLVIPFVDCYMISPFCFGFS